ncbi:hypothetical protein BRADI_2g59161v3 [Brachypodium distachyon]|uniref:C2H2-type domain-containing protein n=1 Tax=Brachypodium distachyon TaxID=15368 RepID=I1HUQ1_BRADI|nr:hypothetical protein BRADI_2g59161v3 [Brachypodium distachyon]
MGDSSAARDYYDGAVSDSDNDDTGYYHHDGAVSSDTAALYRRLQQAAAAVLVPQPATDVELEQQQAVVHPAGGSQQQQQPAGNNNDNQIRGFVCKQEGCGRWFQTHQGLGRHMAGHKNKRLRLQAAAAGGRVERPAPQDSRVRQVRHGVRAGRAARVPQADAQQRQA